MLLKTSHGGFVVVEERKNENPKPGKATQFRWNLSTSRVGEFNRRELFCIAQPAPEIKTHISFLYTVVNPIMIPCSKRQ